MWKWEAASMSRDFVSRGACHFIDLLALIECSLALELTEVSQELVIKSTLLDIQRKGQLLV
jgi:hypothetical protein